MVTDEHREKIETSIANIRCIISVLSFMYLYMFWLLIIVLFVWITDTQLGDVSDLFPNQDVQFWCKSLYLLITLLYLAIAIYGLSGANNKDISAFNLVFVCLIIKFAFEFLVLFNLVFINPINKSNSLSKQRELNFFLGTTTFPLLFDIIMMANVRDLTSLIIGKDKEEESTDDHTTSDSSDNHNIKSKHSFEDLSGRTPATFMECSRRIQAKKSKPSQKNRYLNLYRRFRTRKENNTKSNEFPSTRI